jgi:hypothetical protein
MVKLFWYKSPPPILENETNKVDFDLQREAIFEGAQMRAKLSLLLRWRNMKGQSLLNTCKE